MLGRFFAAPRGKKDRFGTLLEGVGVASEVEVGSGRLSRVRGEERDLLFFAPCCLLAP